MTPAPTTNALVRYDTNQQREIQQLLGFKGTATEITLLFKLAEHYNLDPLVKEISLIPDKGPFIGVWGRLTIAHRDGRLDGLEMDDEWETDKHYCVRVIVWRKDMSRPAAKVIGRVGKHETFKDKTGAVKPKQWPLEIARARGVRTALGFAFSIHDAYDTQDGDEDWTPPPDERLQAQVINVPDAADTREEEPQKQAATRTPAKKRASKRTGGEAKPDEHTTSPPAGHHGASTAQPSPAGPEDSGAAEDAATVQGELTEAAPAAPDTDPPTLQVGGHNTAQLAVIKARAAGVVEEDLRNQLIAYLTGGAAHRATEITDQWKQRVYDGFDALTNGTAELRVYPNGAPYLIKVARR
jgi:hypothetical protein